MRSLKNCVAVVTGASRGIGRAVAIALAREGCDIVAVARDAEALEGTARSVRAARQRAFVQPTDLSRLLDIEATVDAIQRLTPRVDILYNGAAGQAEEDIYGIDCRQIGDFIQSTLTGTIWLTKLLLPVMPAGSHIINIVTDWALPNSGGPSTFVAGKCGILGFGQALSKEVIKKGIRVTNILPGDVASDLALDDGIAAVAARHGEKMIPLADLIGIMLAAIRLDSAKIDQIVITPSDPNYG